MNKNTLVEKPLIHLPDGGVLPVEHTLTVEEIYRLHEALSRLDEQRYDVYVEEDGRLRLLSTGMTMTQIEHVSNSLWRTNQVCDEHIDSDGRFIFRVCVLRSKRGKRPHAPQITW